jgi:hypothetical protein
MKTGTSKAKEDGKKKNKVNEEVANKMSFFFAYPTPMMKVLIDTALKADEQVKREELVAGLSLLANVCHSMLDSKTSELSVQTKMQLLCAMTGTIILVDHLSESGVFHKKSTIRIKACIQYLKNFTDASPDFLLNSLRFTTAHLNDDTTMAEIKKLLL